MFCITMMIRNYYEVHGTFDGIQDTILHDRIEEMRKGTGLSYDDFLYTQLGYQKVNEGPLSKLSIQELAEARALFITRQSKALAQKLGIPEEGSFNSIFKDAGIPILSFKIKQEKLEDRYADIINLLAFYYKNDTNLYCIVNKRPLPLFYSLEVLCSKSTNIRKTIDALMEDKEVVRSLAKIRCRKDSKLLIQGKYCITPNNYTNEEKDMIQRKALEIACFPYTVNLNKLFKVSQNLPFLSFNDNAKYLKMLDFAKGIGSTYQEIANTYGINLPDQLPVFNKYGILLFKLTKDESYFIDAQCDAKNRPYKQGNQMFS